MQVAASNPEYLCEEDVPQEAIDKEKEVLIQQAINEGKPQNIAEKMVEGRMHKFYERVCLLDQPFIKDPSITVNDLLKDKIAKIGENIKIRRFVRYEVGEGLEKREEDFAAEVAKQMGQLYMAYKRIVLKLSGEALAGSEKTGICLLYTSPSPRD